MWRSNQKVKDDVARWQDAGWVTPGGADAILDEILSKHRGAGPAAVMGLLGAVLFGFAAMSFVAANWHVIPRIVRVALLISAMGGAYFAGGLQFQRGRAAFAHAAVLAGASLFGANIMLIGQMYHIGGSPSGALLTWSLGALAAGVLAGSNPTLVLSLILTCFWGGSETLSLAEHASASDSHVFWPFLAGWAGVTAAIAANRWQRGLELAALVLSGWIISLGFFLPGGHAHAYVMVIGLCTAGAGAYLANHVPGSSLARSTSDTLILNGALVAGAGVYCAQFLQPGPLGGFGPWATIALALAVAAVWSGLQAGRTSLTRLGYAAFCLEVLTIYLTTIGSLLGSAAFFLVTGLILLALAAVAIRFEKTTGVVR